MIPPPLTPHQPAVVTTYIIPPGTRGLPGGANFTFNLIADGDLVINDTTTPTPGSITFGNPPTYLDVGKDSSLDFIPPFNVSFGYTPAHFPDMQPGEYPHILHYENGAWVDVTVGHDPVNHIVFGTVYTYTLSPWLLVLLRPPRPPPPPTTNPTNITVQFSKVKLAAR